MHSTRERPGHSGLHAHLGHARPGVEDMGDVILREHGKVVRAEILAVADLDPVTKAPGKRPEKAVELLAKRRGIRKHRLGERAELEHQRGDPVTIRLERSCKGSLEQMVIQERRVGLARRAP